MQKGLEDEFRAFASAVRQAAGRGFFESLVTGFMFIDPNTVRISMQGVVHLPRTSAYKPASFVAQGVVEGGLGILKEMEKMLNQGFKYVQEPEPVFNREQSDWGSKASGDKEVVYMGMELAFKLDALLKAPGEK